MLWKGKDGGLGCGRPAPQTLAAWGTAWACGNVHERMVFTALAVFGGLRFFVRF
jgi:hypothetical protein